MSRKLSLILLALVLAGIGMAGGWIAGTQSAGGGKAASVPHEEPGHADAAPKFSEQTLKNLRVTSGKVALGEFVRQRSVLAVIADPPTNTRPVHAPLGGIVTEVRAVQGTLVKAGEVLLVVARDAIARPELTLTADILTPVSENLHESVSKLRTAISHLKIARTELERVRAFTTTGTVDGLPVLPRKAEIDVRYEVDRSEQEVANSRNELERHGLSTEEITAVEKGTSPPGSQRLWKRALERNALWNEVTESMLQSLPETERELPWSVAAIGELAAAGLASAELLTAMKEVPQVSGRFVEVAGLLLQGHTVEHVRLLAESGALASSMLIKAPFGGAPDWDVAAVAVRAGQRVAAGESLVDLHDARTMWMRLEPVGEELGDVVRALEQRLPVTASPLIDNSGPALSDLRIDRLETRGEDRERGAGAYLTCRNEPVGSPDPEGRRSWRLRGGLRYVVHIPVEVFKERFVLSADAVTEDGPDRVVFIVDGDGFRKRVVHVEHEDEARVVIANDGSVFAGDIVVLSGAFQLGLALQAGKGVVDAHAGHQH